MDKKIISGCNHLKTFNIELISLLATVKSKKDPNLIQISQNFRNMFLHLGR